MQGRTISEGVAIGVGEIAANILVKSDVCISNQTRDIASQYWGHIGIDDGDAYRVFHKRAAAIGGAQHYIKHTMLAGPCCAAKSTSGVIETHPSGHTTLHGISECIARIYIAKAIGSELIAERDAACARLIDECIIQRGRIIGVGRTDLEAIFCVSPAAIGGADGEVHIADIAVCGGSGKSSDSSIEAKPAGQGTADTIGKAITAIDIVKAICRELIAKRSVFSRILIDQRRVKGGRVIHIINCESEAIFDIAVCWISGTQGNIDTADIAVGRRAAEAVSGSIKAEPAG